MSDRRVYCGSFEAEAYWRPPDLAELPAIKQPRTHAIEAMDELLFAFCRDDDILITKRPLLSHHQAYLDSIGFRFTNNRFPLSPDAGVSGLLPPNVFDVLKNPALIKNVSKHIPAGSILEPFAVLDGLDEVLQIYGFAGQHPSMPIVRRVNAKSYGLKMREQISLPPIGLVIDDAERIVPAGLKLLETGPFLIKDEFGVSGKGSLKIESEGILRRIAQHVIRQEGKKVSFVLEPFLDKEIDFCSQFRIQADGRFDFIAVNHLHNAGLSFDTSVSPGPKLRAVLERSRYFEALEEIGAGLFADGYYGDVCIDSMLLSDESLVPIVEINARKSMSMIKNSLAETLGMSGDLIGFTSVAAVAPPEAQFEDVLNTLDGAGLLYDGSAESGVLPLTSGTLFTQELSPHDSRKGRLFFMVAGQPEDVGRVRGLASEAMTKAGLRL